jgi:sec-independent protein translocase protein TatA
MNLELAVFGGLGGWEILLILMVLLIFFGAKKIPELARGLGKGIREFKDATSEIKEEIEGGVRDLENTANKSTTSTKK